MNEYVQRYGEQVLKHSTRLTTSMEQLSLILE
jgi:hypothetical protein